MAEGGVPARGPAWQTRSIWPRRLSARHGTGRQLRRENARVARMSFSAETETNQRTPPIAGMSATKREFSGSARLRGGAGRTRTAGHSPRRVRCDQATALVVIPLVTHGITFINRLQLWSQPAWIVVHLIPFVAIAIVDFRSFEAWTQYEVSLRAQSVLSM
jgi:hypothetical protein